MRSILPTPVSGRLARNHHVSETPKLTPPHAAVLGRSPSLEARTPRTTHIEECMRRLLKIYMEKPELAGVVLLVVLAAVFQARSNSVFLSAENLRGVLGLIPETGLVAIGVTILMICGEFDLSVGSVFALMPMSFAIMLNDGVPFVPAVLIGLAISAAIGFIHGYVTIRFAIPSFIATLGMLFMARSLTVVISGGFPPLLTDVPSWIFTQYVGPGGLVRMSFLWFVVIALLAAG